MTSMLIQVSFLSKFNQAAPAQPLNQLQTVDSEVRDSEEKSQDALQLPLAAQALQTPLQSPKKAVLSK